MKFRIALCVVIAAMGANLTSARAGDLYVVDEYAGTIGQYNATTGATINGSFVSGLGSFGPRDLKASGGDLYTSSNSGSVGQYNATTGATINAAFETEAGRSTGLALSGSNLYVTGDEPAAYVNGYNASGPTFSDAPSAAAGAWGAAVMGNTLYVSLVSSYNAGQGSIAEYNATTGALIDASFITGLNVPEGLAVVGNALYVVNNNGSGFTIQNNGSIGEYNATTGSAINPSLVTGLYQPVAIALNGNDLYVTSNPDVLGQPGYFTTTAGLVGEYNATSGAVINASFISGFQDPQGIVFLPEPATWIMLAIGAAAVLACRNRRRRSQA